MNIRASQFLFLCLSVVLAASGVSRAESFAILGPQAMGMGGAFTAIARGNLAQHWNPAGLAQDNNVSGIQIPFGFRGEFTGGLLKDVNNLSNIAAKYSAIKTAQTSGASINADQAGAFFQGVAALGSLNKPGKGLLIDVSGGVDIKIGKIAVSVNNYTSVGGSPYVDTKNIGLGAATGMSGVTFAGGSVDTTIAAGNVAASDQIESAINTVGYVNFETLICGSAGCLAAQNGAITNADSLANALVDQAEDAGSSAADISAAAQIIADNAAAVAPIIGAAASGNPYTNNGSNLTLRGASFTEIALGHARPLLLPGLLVGGNLKMIQGRVGYERFTVLNKEVTGSKAYDDFDKNTKTTVQPGVDLGVIYDLNKLVPILPFRPRAGLVARNINRPKFDMPDVAKANGEGAKYALDSQVRMGAALNPFNFWTLSADVDLTENKTPVKDFKSRMFGAGTEINVFNRKWLNIPLRAGIMKNIAESNSKVSYTGGFGLNFLHVLFDIGGSISSETEKYRDEKGKQQEVPSNAAVSAQLSILF